MNSCLLGPWGGGPSRGGSVFERARTTAGRAQAGAGLGTARAARHAQTSELEDVAVEIGPTMNAFVSAKSDGGQLLSSGRKVYRNVANS